MTKKTKQTKRRPAVEYLEERTLLSSTPTWVPLDQLLTQSLARPGSIPPLSALNLYSPNINHVLAPTGQIPPGAVQVGVSGETGEQVFAVANKYIAQINITGLSAAAAADPKQLLGHAVGELAVAKLANPGDTGLASISIDKYLGAGRYLVTAGTNFDLDSLTPELAKLPGFQNAVEDFLFPSTALQAAQTSTNAPAIGPSANTAAPLTLAPVPALTEVGAAGGLVFSGSTSQTVSGAGVSISFTVLLDAGQTVAAVVTPRTAICGRR